MENKQIEALLEKYRAGRATEAESAMLESWYLQRDITSVNLLSPGELNDDLSLIGEGLPLYQPVRKINPWRRIAAVAAALAIFFTAYLEWPVIQNKLHPVRFAALTVPLNQKRQITLADGSQVWVNSGSELKYPQTFNGKTREVYLSGEAYFDVAHDAAKPFLIHTGKVITTVLGTAFDIKEDKTSHTVVVTVTRGKVSVASGGKSLGVLTPNQQLSFNVENNKVVQQKVDAIKVVAWRKVDLHFEDVSFAEAAKQLEQRFNVKISFTNERLKNCRFTGSSLTGESFSKVLKAVCDFNNATYKTLSDGSILIDGTGCN